MNNQYGELPAFVKKVEIIPSEMMFYQYLPIKMPGGLDIRLEPRLKFLEEVIHESVSDFVDNFGHDRLDENHIYVTIKNMFQSPGCSFNREGWHSDGFMTDDVNYIWYSAHPTIFNRTKFQLTPDDKISMREMEKQARKDNDVIFPSGSLLRLNQYNIHRVSNSNYSGMRLFVKISFSRDRYDLAGNSHNYEFDYNWHMKPRNNGRNIPQSNIKKLNLLDEK